MKYGVKLTAIDSMDFDDLNIICQAIKKLGYKITVVDNGNFVCEKESEIAETTGLSSEKKRREHERSKGMLEMW